MPFLVGLRQCCYVPVEEEAHEEVEEEAPKDETEIQVDVYVEWR